MVMVSTSRRSVGGKGTNRDRGLVVAGDTGTLERNVKVREKRERANREVSADQMGLRNKSK